MPRMRSWTFTSKSPLKNEFNVRSISEIPKVEPHSSQGRKTFFEVYRCQQHHELAVTKATRDLKMVVLYASLAVLKGDPQWMRDKLLPWIRSSLNIRLTGVEEAHVVKGILA